MKLVHVHTDGYPLCPHSWPLLLVTDRDRLPACLAASRIIVIVIIAIVRARGDDQVRVARLMKAMRACHSSARRRSRSSSIQNNIHGATPRVDPWGIRVTRVPSDVRTPRCSMVKSPATAVLAMTNGGTTPKRISSTFIRAVARWLGLGDTTVMG